MPEQHYSVVSTLYYLNSFRITSLGFKLKRPSVKIGRYTMIKANHFRSSKPDPNRYVIKYPWIKVKVSYDVYPVVKNLESIFIDLQKSLQNLSRLKRFLWIRKRSLYKKNPKKIFSFISFNCVTDHYLYHYPVTVFDYKVF